MRIDLLRRYDLDILKYPILLSVVTCSCNIPMYYRIQNTCHIVSTKYYKRYRCDVV